MLQAMLAGVASIKAHQAQLNVIGNNIANVNTTAFKASRMGFQELLAQTVTGASRPNDNVGGVNPLQIGLGCQVASADTIQDQGSLQSTNRSTDFALQGPGYFMVTDGNVISYTRDGTFALDANGTLVHRSTGQKLLGWSADASGDIDTTGQVTSLSGIQIPMGVLTSVQATTSAPFVGNLDARAIPADSRMVRTTVYDSLGGLHEIEMTFSNHTVGSFLTGTASSSWDWSAEENGVAIGTSATAGNSPLYFDDEGQAVLPNPAPAQDVIITPTNGAGSLPISIDFTQIQQVEAAANVQAGQANGYQPGTLASFTVGQDGIISGTFTNGFSRPLARIAVSVFANPSGLERTGNNFLRQSDNSGLPAIGAPTDNGRASVSVGYLEQSNVDIGDQFTNMIITQRGFQANTRVVTTVDDMMQELINMKR